MNKTNVMRLLDSKKIPYESFEYSKELTEGTLIAETLGEEKLRVFKTLVTESNTKEHFVFVIPVSETLDLKAAARAVGVKSICMLKQKDLLPLTGYVHGGCSPIGMKKAFKTVFDDTAQNFDTIFVSGGKIGSQIKINPNILCDFVRGSFSQITVK